MTKRQSNILLIILLTIKLPAISQELEYTEIAGEVGDESYKSIAFVNIVSKKTGLGTISHENGKFHIRVLVNDTLIFSALAYKRKSIPVKHLSFETNYVTLEKNIFQLGEVNVMNLRWKKFQYDVINKNLKREEQSVLPIEGLPDPFKKKIELSPYAGNTNPLSLLLTYFKKTNIRKRKQNRWNKTYRKSWTEKQ